MLLFPGFSHKPYSSRNHLPNINVHLKCWFFFWFVWRYWTDGSLSATHMSFRFCCLQNILQNTHQDLQDPHRKTLGPQMFNLEKHFGIFTNFNLWIRSQYALYARVSGGCCQCCVSLKPLQRKFDTERMWTLSQSSWWVWLLTLSRRPSELKVRLTDMLLFLFLS